MSTRPGPSQKPGEVLLDPLRGAGAVGKGLFHGLECPVVRENAAVCAHHPQLVMEHFMVNHVFDHKSRNHWTVQHRMDPDDSFIRAIGSQAYTPGSASPFPRSPSDGATISASEIDLVKPLEVDSQMDMPSLGTKTGASRSYWNLRRPDLLFVLFDEGPQQAFVPDGRPPNERGKRSEHILRSVEKHVMKPNRAESVSPSHRDHGSRVVRDGQRQREAKKLTQLGLQKGMGGGRPTHCFLSRLLLALFIIESPVSLKRNLRFSKEVTLSCIAGFTTIERRTSSARKWKLAIARNVWRTARRARSLVDTVNFEPSASSGNSARRATKSPGWKEKPRGKRDA